MARWPRQIESSAEVPAETILPLSQDDLVISYIYDELESLFCEIVTP